MKKFYRSGDINLHEVKELKGKVIKHSGSFCLAKGEVTNSEHRIIADRVEDMVLAEDEMGNVFIQLKTPALLTHTHDHETITVEPGIYEVIHERELDHFAESVERRVQD